MMNFVVRIKSNHYASKLSINNVKNMVPENFEHLVCHIHAEVLPNSSLPTLIKSQVALPREIILELELCTICQWQEANLYVHYMICTPSAFMVHKVLGMCYQLLKRVGCNQNLRFGSHAQCGNVGAQNSKRYAWKPHSRLSAALPGSDTMRSQKHETLFISISSFLQQKRCITRPHV